ncbi:MAG: zinc-ribbon domain-containing protein [Clostridia bacterium]|nr:zinc-ribbon domain-containing protein [Clostridia bacterium]
MFCDSCGKKIDDGARFCEHCGMPMFVNLTEEKLSGVFGTKAETKICPHCGTELPAQAKFCDGCGSRLNAAAPAPTGRVCGHCGAVMPDGFGFCDKCGTRL